MGQPGADVGAAQNGLGTESANWPRVNALLVFASLETSLPMLTLAKHQKPFFLKVYEECKHKKSAFVTLNRDPFDSFV